MSETIYKIVTPEQWQEALADGVFKGAPIDLTDGFIHFSTRTQVVETATKHFKNSGDLLLIGFDPAKYGDQLKWEVSRGGELFPHLYGTLTPSDALQISELPQRSDGSHTFPEGF